MSPNTEPMLTTREGLAASSNGIRSRVSAIGAITLVRNVRLSASSSNFSIAPPSTTPALLTSTSRAFHLLPMISTMRRRPSGFVISAGMTKCWFSRSRSARVTLSASSRRPHSATFIPRCATSTARARPIPEPAPVISTHFCSRGMAQLRAGAKIVKDRAIQSVEDGRVVDDDALRLPVMEAVDQPPEESVGADMFDAVVRVSHHDPAGSPALAVADRVGVAAKRADIVEDPFLVTVLFLHIFEQGILIAPVRGA